MSFITQIGIYLTVACAAFTQVAQAPVDSFKSQELANWKTVRSKRCSLKMPSIPYSSSHTNQVRGEQFNYDVLVAPVENKAVYILLVAEYPRAIPKNNQQASLEQFLTWISSQNPEQRHWSNMILKCHPAIFASIYYKKKVCSLPREASWIWKDIFVLAMPINRKS